MSVNLHIENNTKKSVKGIKFMEKIYYYFQIFIIYNIIILIIISILLN